MKGNALRAAAVGVALALAAAGEQITIRPLRQVRAGGATVEVEAKDLRPGQVLVVRPGERVATDGIVRTGRSSLDTSAITGESIPVEVGPGDTVSAGDRKSVV